MRCAKGVKIKCSKSAKIQKVQFQYNVFSSFYYIRIALSKENGTFYE